MTTYFFLFGLFIDDDRKLWVFFCHDMEILSIPSAISRACSAIASFGSDGSINGKQKSHKWGIPGQIIVIYSQAEKKFFKTMCHLAHWSRIVHAISEFDMPDLIITSFLKVLNKWAVFGLTQHFLQQKSNPQRIPKIQSESEEQLSLSLSLSQSWSSKSSANNFF